MAASLLCDRRCPRIPGPSYRWKASGMDAGTKCRERKGWNRREKKRSRKFGMSTL